MGAGCRLGAAERTPCPEAGARPVAGRTGACTMTERFSEYLRARVEPIWRAQHEHPFVRGIGDGTLPADRFRHWIRQDYRFLIEYCRLFGLAAARAPDL